jgi:hypothetical protein
MGLQARSNVIAMQTIASNERERERRFVFGTGKGALESVNFEQFERNIVLIESNGVYSFKWLPCLEPLFDCEHAFKRHEKSA